MQEHALRMALGAMRRPATGKVVVPANFNGPGQIVIAGHAEAVDAALEAAKQCGNPFLPEILPVQRAAAFMESARGFDLKLIASLRPGAKSLKPVLAAFRTTQNRAPVKVLWLVGPEGDFTPAELSAARSAGFEPITLGPLVLRCETAAVYALSVMAYELATPAVAGE